MDCKIHAIWFHPKA